MDSSQKFPCERDSFRFYESSDTDENEDEGLSPVTDIECTSLSMQLGRIVSWKVSSSDRASGII